LGRSALPGPKGTIALYDVIVVGAGHNGLTCAAYLARAGRRILVLEAREVVGGLAWTMEMPNAPGYKVNPCSVEFLLTGVEPSVDHELDLARHGLRWVYPDTLLTWLGPDGQVMPIWRDRNRLVEEIRRYSRKDARRYEQLCDEITTTLKVALPYLQGHPIRVRPAALAEMLYRAAKGPRDVARGARVMLSSIEQVCEEYFDRDEIKVPVATYSLASFAPSWEAGTGLHLSLIAGLHEWGVRHPVGGTGAFTQALARCIESRGGTILTNAKVAEVLTTNGRAHGVRLLDGRIFAGETIVAATDPVTLMTKLLDPGVVPEDTRDEIRSLQNLHSNIYTFKVDAALDRRLTFGRYQKGRGPEALSAITVCPDMDYLNRSAHAAINGEFNHEIPIQHITSSVYDRTLVPAGSDGDTLYLYAFNTPRKLSGDRSWDDEKDQYVKLMMDNFAQYAPGLGDAVLDLHVTTPADFESRYHIAHGNYEHVDCSLTQMGPTRPVPSMAGWKTPIDGLWHTGAGSFPMAFLSGWPGRSSAREILRPTLKERVTTRLRGRNVATADGWTQAAAATSRSV
jgi:beta-carotene ketolase (CrtO type)